MSVYRTIGPLVTIGTSLITNGTIGQEIDANDKNGNAIGTNGTNVTNLVPLAKPPNARMVKYITS